MPPQDGLLVRDPGPSERRPGDPHSDAFPESRGDAHPARPRAQLDEIVPLVYEQLRSLAHARLARRGPAPSLDTTGLVHEAYVKLAGSTQLGWRDREHFLAMASRVMRQVLVDRARSRGALKRGGERRRTTLTGQTIPVDDQARALLELEDALQQLATVSPRLVQVVECRFFGGMSEVEIAAALGVTDRTVRRDWDKARLLLRSALEGVSATEGSET